MPQAFQAEGYRDGFRQTICAGYFVEAPKKPYINQGFKSIWI
jgi:hypothetical protein